MAVSLRGAFGSRDGWLNCTVRIVAILFSGATVPTATFATEHIAASELLGKRLSAALIENAAFIPDRAARNAHGPFTGYLDLREAAMATRPAALASGATFDRDPTLFPTVSIGFITVGKDLVPITQDVIRSGSTPRGHSYWDMIVQPGRVWSEVGDGPWSRAAFPFALVNSREGETHNGVALFLYRPGQVSCVRFQIVQQTAPYNIGSDFSATGCLPATVRSDGVRNANAVEKTYRASLRDEIAFGTWSELAERVGADKLDGFERDVANSDTVLTALDYRGVLYLQSCNTAAGPLPWCDRARFGVWSATKSLLAEIALLRLAQKYGASVFGLMIGDYVVAASGEADWRGIQFEHAIDMATGLSNGAPKPGTGSPFEDTLDATYSRWYEARSADEKVAILVRTAHRDPQGPGRTVRYRDQDIFVLGVAMDHFLKTREGPQASLRSMLEEEVFKPIGIHYSPLNRTIEGAESAGLPILPFGYYPTLGDIVKLARLYQNAGRHAGRQILYAPRIAELLDGRVPQGLATGLHTTAGDIRYFNSFWQVPVESIAGCRRYYPRMEGWGGTIVALFPGGLTGIRIAKVVKDENGSASDTRNMAMVADRMVPFCRE